MKEEFFSKFKDYNKELEKILEKKDFSQDTKNLLLSMFYKFENSYKDYFLVKRKCKTKQQYLENIFDNIKRANSIQLVKTNDLNFNELKENGLYKIDFKLKRILVLENEFAMLSALLSLNDFQVYVKEEYNLIKEPMSYLLNIAYDMEKIEVIRDFNAWSWNAVVEEIKDININLVYQNLKIALNINIFEKLENLDFDIVNYIKQTLTKLYDKELAETFIRLIYKIAIIICIKNNNEEKLRLQEEKKSLELSLIEITDKKGYVEEITKEKKQLQAELRRLDLIINNRDLLLEEYNKRNSKLEKYNKIFNIGHLVEKLQKERLNILNKIEIYNKKIEPETYLKNREKLQEDYNLLYNINFESENDIYKYIDKLQEIFIKYIFKKKIEKASTKSEIIECMYELRYYKFLPYNNEKNIKDLEFLKLYIEQAEEILVKKMYDNKIINTISTNLGSDIKILKNIFNLKIINMESIYIEINKMGEKYVLGIYDEKETLENEQEINLDFNKKDKIKLNKRIRLFKEK